VALGRYRYGHKIEKRLPWGLHRALADWNILKNHILPLLEFHGDDPEVLYECMVVMYLMTQLPPKPVINLDDEKQTNASPRAQRPTPNMSH
jgi:hypothetical protein